MVPKEGDDAPVYFVLQKEKGKTPDGGIYYAVYSDCLGSTEEVEYREGRHVLIEDYVFENDYDVFIRDSLASFFGVDGALSGGAAGRAEGGGFDTPEDAVTAYIKGWQDNDLHKMLSAFAVETYAENYSLAKAVDRMGAYMSSLEYIPSISPLAVEINAEQRRGRIMREIKGHYLVLTESKSIDDEYGGYAVALKDFDSADGLVEALFASNDEKYVSDITTDGVFLDPDQLSPQYSSEGVQKNLGRQAAVAGADEIRSVVTTINAGGERYLLCMDVVRYGDKWYILDAGGTVGALLGIDSYHMGMIRLPEGDIEELMTEMVP